MCSRRYEGRWIVIDSASHLYVPFAQVPRRAWLVEEALHRPDFGQYYGDVNS